MEPVFVRERMTRDEMFERYPLKYLLVLQEDDGIGKLSQNAGKKTGYVLAAFDSSTETYQFSDEETKSATSRRTMWSGDYTEEVINLGFIFGGDFHGKDIMYVHSH